VRILFVKHSLAWPRSSGHDVHTFHMMQAFGDLGHEVSLATVVPPEPAAIEGARIAHRIRLSAPLDGEPAPLPGTRLQHKFRSFWGVEDHWVQSLRQANARLRPDAVIVGGLDALPYFPALTETTRVWYAADEWILHHLSQLQATWASWRENLEGALIKGVYEWAHRDVIDRVWVVSESDQRAMRRVLRRSAVDLLPNGVDAGVFAPGREPRTPDSAVFWGRLDFGPNIQALEWFCNRVWPRVRARRAGATLTIIGFQPTEPVRRLATRPGISLQANLRDLRGTARSHSLAVLPFVSGAGIKNKLLEAAAMGLPIVGTETAARGLRGESPLVVARSPADFATAMIDLWSDDARRQRLAVEGREWVLRNHSWLETARQAADLLSQPAQAVR
jgi:glycosyltransferase involved in cell wall biosynthesis